jgi:hypothetical protein
MMYGPHFTRFDLTAGQEVRITERVNVELRGEFLNAFNNINFLIGSAAGDTNSVTNRSAATFGQITSRLSGHVDHQRSWRTPGCSSC